MKTLVKFQYRKEGFLWYFYVSYLLHFFLSFFLLFQQFSFSRNISPITFGCHVFSYCFHCFASNDFDSDTGLYGDVELLAGDEFFQFFAHSSSKGLGIVIMDECGDGIYLFTV